MKYFSGVLFLLLCSIVSRADVVISNLGWDTTGHVALGDNEIIIENIGGFAPNTQLWDSITIKLYNNGASSITGLSFNLNGLGTFSNNLLSIGAGQYGLATVDIKSANLFAVENVNSTFQLTGLVATGGEARWAIATDNTDPPSVWAETPPYAYLQQSLVGGSGLDTNYGQFSLSVTPVPEPGTLLMGAFAAVAGVGGIWSRRKMKQNNAA